MNKNQRAQHINTKKKGKDTEDNKNKGVNKKKGIFFLKFGVLAEIRRGRGLKGVHEPNMLSGIFLLFKNDLIDPKHEKKPKNKNVIYKMD